MNNTVIVRSLYGLHPLFNRRTEYLNGLRFDSQSLHDSKERSFLQAIHYDKYSPITVRYFKWAYLSDYLFVYTIHVITNLIFDVREGCHRKRIHKTNKQHFLVQNLLVHIPYSIHKKVIRQIRFVEIPPQCFFIIGLF